MNSVPDAIEVPVTTAVCGRAAPAVPVASARAALLETGWRGAPDAWLGADALQFKVLAGILVGLSTWARWIALSLAPVGVVLALTQVSVPVVVLLLAPLIVGWHLERVTARVWLGASTIIGGSLLLVWAR